MSATFKIAKKKYTQNDLRRLMNEQKSKVKQTTSAPKIDSPLAKYNEGGQLTCVLCKSIVRSESVWKVHINTKLHKENVAAAKQLKERLESTSSTFKRPGDTKTSNVSVPEKKLKPNPESTTRTKTESNSKDQSMPSDFFDSKTSKSYFEVTLGKTTIKKDLINIKRESHDSTAAGQNGISKMEVDDVKDDQLPEGFFDDPVKDAKVRNQEYKDPQDEEWDRFQREIKEESTVSNAIMAEEQDEATAERQIEEIDEQIRKWSKVLDLEKRKEVVTTKAKTRSSQRMSQDTAGDSDLSEGSDDEFDEFLDWRAKDSHR